jgi:lysyl-tRNA synthetase class 2
LSYVARATREVLRRRAALLATIRAFFAARNVLEVETPALSTAAVPDLALESLTAGAHTFGERRLYLHTSPEYAMKRLLAAGVGDIYQICRVFRDDELGRWHQPEFTLLEWYRIGWDDNELMREVEALVQIVLATGETLTHEGEAQAAEPKPVRCVTYAAAFAERLGCELGDESGIRAGLTRLGIDVPPDLELAALTDLAFGAAVAPHFPPDSITFVHDYPADQAALARIKAQSPAVAARFELFAGGVELGNGFAELTDAAEQRRRFEAERAVRRRTGRHVPPLDEAFLAALERGLPECAGVALGLDRLVAVALELDDLGSALAFEHQPFAS